MPEPFLVWLSSVSIQSAFWIHEAQVGRLIRILSVAWKAISAQSHKNPACRSLLTGSIFKNLRCVRFFLFHSYPNLPVLKQAKRLVRNKMQFPFLGNMFIHQKGKKRLLFLLTLMKGEYFWGRRKERVMGFEPTNLTLGRWCLTTWPHPHSTGL